MCKYYNLTAFVQCICYMQISKSECIFTIAMVYAQIKTWLHFDDIILYAGSQSITIKTLIRFQSYIQEDFSFSIKWRIKLKQNKINVTNKVSGHKKKKKHYKNILYFFKESCDSLKNSRKVRMNVMR